MAIMNHMPDPLSTRTDSYLLRLSPEERKKLESISRDLVKPISDTLRDLIEQEWKRRKK